MTALKQYDRLESTGLWREDAEAQRREVAVSFGKATLVIADGAGRPITHWSLPAVERLPDTGESAVFAPDADASETLEIGDATMVEAIETVRKTLARQRPQPGKLRHLTTLAIVILALALTVFWLPGALRSQTLAVVPQIKRTEIGAVILGHMQAQTGPVCRGAAGQRALDALQVRLMGRDSAGQIVVMPTGLGSAVTLPGGIIVLDRTVLRSTDDPAVAAGHVLHAHGHRLAADPLGDVLDAAGLQQTMRLLTTGDLSGEVLRDYAQSLLSASADDEDDADLVAIFDAARVPLTPYVQSLPSIHADLAAQDPLAGETVPLVLTDQNWVALQGICEG